MKGLGFRKDLGSKGLIAEVNYYLGRSIFIDGKMHEGCGRCSSFDFAIHVAATLHHVINLFYSPSPRSPATTTMAVNMRKPGCR